MSKPRDHDHPSYAVSNAKDERARKLFRLRGGHRVRLYDQAAVRQRKVEREADAAAWIAKLKARSSRP